jgi:DNA mismatch repair protein MutS
VQALIDARAASSCATPSAASATWNASCRAWPCARRARATCPRCATAVAAALIRADPGRTGFAAPAGAAHELGEHDATARLLRAPSWRSPPALLRDGGAIADGFDAELDELRRAQSTNADQFLVDLEAREREATGIATLKVGYNRVHGYYIEISKGQSDKAPVHYTRRQTLTGAERYITEELKAFEDKVLSARERALSREKLLYERARRCSTRCSSRCKRCAAALSELDVLCRLRRTRAGAGLVAAHAARRARPADRARPASGGRGSARRSRSNRTTCGSTATADARHHRPEHGRQEHLHAPERADRAAGHIGSFVPAMRGDDRPDRPHPHPHRCRRRPRARAIDLHGRDERNQLHPASRDGTLLVLMDEIGRGTSTYDGLALARGLRPAPGAEQSRYTLFATHYFELTALAEPGSGANVHLDAVEHGDRLVFMHAVKDGPANRSFGLQVAALAGLPKAAVPATRTGGPTNCGSTCSTSTPTAPIRWEARSTTARPSRASITRR